MALAAAYQAEQGIRRQKLMMADAKQRGIKQGRCALGTRVGLIDPVLAAQCRRIHGERCFSDPEFLPWLMRHNPEIVLEK